MRLWCGHRVGDRWPRTLVLNGNGNLNIAGADAPLHLGAAFRSILAGTAFDATSDVEVDLDDLALFSDNEVLHMLANATSSAFEAVLRLSLVWDATGARPVVDIETAVIARAATPVGFGSDFMKGGVLYGGKGGSTKQPIAGFHDALMAYLRDPETQRASPIRLTPPNDTGRLPQVQAATTAPIRPSGPRCPCPPPCATTCSPDAGWCNSKAPSAAA